MAALLYPFLFLRFWYFEGTVSLLQFYRRLNVYVAHLLSLPLLASTFFQPLKNEYRKDLIAFSIGMGIVLKTVLISASLSLMLFLLLCEGVLFLFYLTLPIIPVYILVR